MSGAPQVLTVRISLAIRQHGGRKVVLAPQGAVPALALRARVDSALVTALARAYRWKRLLEDGRYASISDIADAEQIDYGDLCRILRLTLLAPDTVEAILDEPQPSDLGLPRRMKPSSTE